MQAHEHFFFFTVDVYQFFITPPHQFLNAGQYRKMRVRWRDVFRVTTRSISVRTEGEIRGLEQYTFDNFVGFAASMITMWSWRVPVTVHFLTKMCGERRLKVHTIRVQQAVRHCHPKTLQQQQFFFFIVYRRSEEIKCFLAGGTRGRMCSHYRRFRTQTAHQSQSMVQLKHAQTGCSVCCK